MTEPLQNGEFATKVVKDSITEIKVAMPKELSRSIRFTAAVHVYSWVIRKEKAGELIAWLDEHGFQNIQTDTPVVEGDGVEANVSSGVFTTVTATAVSTMRGCSGGCATLSCNAVIGGINACQNYVSIYCDNGYYYQTSCYFSGDNTCENLGQGSKYSCEHV